MRFIKRKNKKLMQKLVANFDSTEELKLISEIQKGLSNFKRGSKFYNAAFTIKMKLIKINKNREGLIISGELIHQLSETLNMLMCLEQDAMTEALSTGGLKHVRKSVDADLCTTLYADALTNGLDIGEPSLDEEGLLLWYNKLVLVDGGNGEVKLDYDYYFKRDMTKLYAEFANIINYYKLNNMEYEDKVAEMKKKVATVNKISDIKNIKDFILELSLDVVGDGVVDIIDDDVKDEILGENA